MSDDQELTQAVAALRDATSTLTEAIQSLNRLLQQRADESSWIPLREAAERMRVSARYLRSNIHNGSYKHGTHYVDTSNGDRPNYLVSVAAVKKELAKPPEKRNTVRKLTSG